MGGLIEVRLVVALFVIAFAVGIPAYLDYRKRSKVGEGLEAAALARDAITKAFVSGGPADMSQRAVTGYVSPSAGEIVQRITVAKSGTITISYSEAVGYEHERVIQVVPVANGKALDLSEPASKGAKLEWQCGGDAGRTTVPKTYRPQSCR